MKINSHPPLSLAWFIWSLCALFYLMGFFQRVAPAVMTRELMQDFGIGAAALGNLSALYFYSYVVMQIPTGVLADRLGPRRLLSLGAFIAGMGTVLFALAQDILWADIGRFLIGGSVAVAFVGLLKIAVNWFPPRYFAMISGMALFFGIVGAVSAGPPLRMLMNSFDWRSVILCSAGITFFLCVAIWVFVRDNPHERGYADLIKPEIGKAGRDRYNVLQGLVQVVKHRNILLLFVIPGGVVGCVLTFSGLWGVPYLSTHQGLSTTQASVLTSTLMVAWAVGGPVFGWTSDRLGHRKPLYLIGCLGALAGWLVIVFFTGVPVPVLFFVLLLTGFCSGCMVLSFAFGKESVPQSLSGTVAGVINMGVMLGPMLLQPLVGLVLDHLWQGSTADGVRVYKLEAYQTGFSLMLLWLAISFCLLLLTRETHCRQVA
ncbi:MAG: MFS transporter [Desulfohalobiaceae bacterium]|nr:MFS transporter [Desulfohalobiaceae bacterium]